MPSVVIHSSDDDQHASAPTSKRSFFNDMLLFWAVPATFFNAPTPELPESLSTARLSPLAQQLWETELAKAGGRGSDGWVLIRVLYACARNEFWIGMLLSVLQALLATVSKPLLLKYLVDEVSSEDPDDTVLILLVVALACSLLVEGLVTSDTRHALHAHGGGICLTAAATLLHTKAMKLSCTQGQTNESSLLGTDIIRSCTCLLRCLRRGSRHRARAPSSLTNAPSFSTRAQTRT